MGQMDQTDQMDQKNTPTFACYTNIQGSATRVTTATSIPSRTSATRTALRINSKQKMGTFSIFFRSVWSNWSVWAPITLNT